MDSYEDSLKDILIQAGVVALFAIALASPKLIAGGINQYNLTKRAKIRAANTKTKKSTSKKKKYYFTEDDDHLTAKDRRDLGLED